MDMNNLSLKSLQETHRIGVALKARVGWLVALLVLVAAGCATEAPRGRSDEEVIKDRAQLRWNAMVKSDFSTAYSYMSPAGRSIVTKDAYAAGLNPGFWTDAQVRGVTCATPETCEVHLVIEYTYGGRKFKTPLSEKWVKQDSNWWYLHER